MSELSTPTILRILAGWTGALLARFIVPAWIFFGALSKVLGASPKSLPRSILDAGSSIGFSDLHVLLAVLTAIEFVFIGVMLFIPKMARLAAITMLCIFLIVLSVEIYNGAESCGCLGKASLDPKVMFGIDFTLLLGLLFLKPKVSKCRLNKGMLGRTAAITFILVAWIFTFSSIMYAKKSNPIDVGGGSVVNPAASNAPDAWYPRDIASWMGKSIDEIDLFSWVVKLPEDIHTGRHYVIFYGRSCDHCQALFYAHFEFDLQVPTTLVAVPEAKAGFFEEGMLENPCVDCTITELITGVDWIIGTPLVVAIEDGIVKCAIESEDSEVPICLIW